MTEIYDGYVYSIVSTKPYRNILSTIQGNKKVINLAPTFYTCSNIANNRNYLNFLSCVIMITSVQ